MDCNKFLDLLNEINKIDCYNETFIKDFALEYNITQGQVRFLCCFVAAQRMAKGRQNLHF